MTNAAVYKGAAWRLHAGLNARGDQGKESRSPSKDTEGQLRTPTSVPVTMSRWS